jgi:hypothetical protein
MTDPLSAPIYAAGFKAALNLIRNTVRHHPDITVAELLDSLTEVGGMVAGIAEPRDKGTCRFCHQPIALFFSEDGPWVHLNEERNRGCRAASFDADRGWNDSLDRRWTAKPARS